MAEPILRKIPAPPDGALRDCEMVGVLKSTEHTNTYELADGSVLSMRTLVTEIWRVVDQYDAEGNPLYIAKSGNLMTVSAPESLRKKLS